MLWIVTVRTRLCNIDTVKAVNLYDKKTDSHHCDFWVYPGGFERVSIIWRHPIRKVLNLDNCDPAIHGLSRHCQTKPFSFFETNLYSICGPFSVYIFFISFLLYHITGGRAVTQWLEGRWFDLWLLQSKRAPNCSIQAQWRYCKALWGAGGLEKHHINASLRAIPFHCDSVRTDFNSPLPL